jgi:hypothetical protein
MFGFVDIADFAGGCSLFLAGGPETAFRFSVSSGTTEATVGAGGGLPEGGLLFIGFTGLMSPMTTLLSTAILLSEAAGLFCGFGKSCLSCVATGLGTTWRHPLNKNTNRTARRKKRNLFKSISLKQLVRNNPEIWRIVPFVQFLFPAR